MTIFDGSEIAEQWLCILKEELPKQLTPATWLKPANAQLDERAGMWAKQTSEIKQIFRITANNTTVENKNAFIQVLHYEFPSDQNDVMTEEQTSAELLTLSQRKDEDLHAYYR